MQYYYQLHKLLPYNVPYFLVVVVVVVVYLTIVFQ
jgi:hypothetical protein